MDKTGKISVSKRLQFSQKFHFKKAKKNVQRSEDHANKGLKTRIYKDLFLRSESGHGTPV